MTLTDDPTLFDVPEIEDEASLDARFARFHADHPDVYTALHTLTVDLLRQGHRKIGIGMLWEVLRWQSMLGGDVDGYRLNNSLRSRYSRLLMDSDPRLAGVFETRELTS